MNKNFIKDFERDEKCINQEVEDRNCRAGQSG